MPLTENSLRDTIKSVISIDEFEPKSGTEDEIIVVALYAIDEAPARDLDTFVERGPYDIIDVDVSPNPNEEGNYLVFMEFKRLGDFWMKLDSVLEDIANVTGELKWTATCNVLDYETDILDPELRSAVILEPTEDTEEEEVALESYLSNSLLLTVEHKDSIIKISDSNRSMTLEFVALGDADVLIESQKLTGASLMENPYEARKLVNMLGHGWSVNKVADKLVINNSWDDTLLVTKYVE